MCLPRLDAVLQAASSGSSGSGGAADPEAARYLATTMAAALTGVLRVVHLSTTKNGVGHKRPLEACPLLGFLVGVSQQRPDLALAQRLAASAVGAGQQQVQDFSPL